MRRMVLGFAVAVLGCDPVGQLSMTVVDSSGSAVAGATITLTCPANGVVPGAEHTGSDGKWLYQRIPDIDPACTITIDKAGFATRTIQRAEAGYTKGMDKPSFPPIVLQSAR